MHLSRSILPSVCNRVGVDSVQKIQFQDCRFADVQSRCKSRVPVERPYILGVTIAIGGDYCETISISTSDGLQKRPAGGDKASSKVPSLFAFLPAPFAAFGATTSGFNMVVGSERVGGASK